MISSIQDIEYIFTKYGISGLSLIIIFFILLIFNWICKNIFPYYFRKSKLEKLDEYKDKYINLNSYNEKTSVINDIIEAEYGSILLKEKNSSRQKIMIFLLHHNLCRTIKEAKRFAAYLIFEKSQKRLIFNKRFCFLRIFITIICILIFFGLFVYCRMETKQANIPFETYKWFVLCILNYLICLVFAFISSNILANSVSAYNLIKKNPDIIENISSRLLEVNTPKTEKKKNNKNKKL